MLNEAGTPHACDKPYLICDNGYHRWPEMMCPYKSTSHPFLALWSKHLESVRKDVERCFGCMKKRFRILKTPILFRDVAFVNDIFVTCAVLHNKLLDYDKHMEKRYGVFRHGVTPSLTKEGRRTVLVNNVRRLLNASDDFSSIRVSGDIITEVDPGFEPKRKQLARHIFYLFVHKLLKYTVKSYYNKR